VKWLSACCLVFLACGSSEEAEVFDSEDCTNLAFDEVNSDNSSPAFRTEVEDALRLLCQSDLDSGLGFETYKSIATGRVQIDTLEDLSDLDYSTVLVFYEFAPGTPREEALPTILADLAGYMWGDRIYIVPGASTESLAATLAHEVNHVLNRSDENYYLPLDREVTEPERTEILNSLQVDEGRAFVEEYRAFYLEEVYAGASLTLGQEQSMQALKQSIADLYEFNSIDVSEFPDYPDGLLIPDDEGWASRPDSLCGAGLLYFPCE
jgi:hypothetical protein